MHERGKRLREFEVGDMVLERIPGKLEESWRGP